MFFHSKKFLISISIIFILLVILVYVVNINSIPDSIILFEDKEPSLETIAGIKVNEINNNNNDNGYIQISTGIGDATQKNQNIKKYNLSLLGINLKTINANIIENRKVIPLGNLVGLKLYTEGVLVVGMSEIELDDGKKYKPFEGSEIEIGDSIIKINNEKVNSTEELLECVSKSKGKSLEITYVKNGEERNSNITPVKTSKNTYKLGLWVRDAAAGIGTLSFYDELTNSIVSLGHGIQDIDTGEMVEISSGEFVTSNITKIQKGQKQNPGRIEGNMENEKNIGKIYSNTKFGVFGKLVSEDNLNLDYSKQISIATRNEIKEGSATIYCTLENGKIEEYNVNIQKIFKNNNKNNKSMIVKITDKRLLEKTGGIIQGMSGSPIIQNGKLIGALTHVLVSDPTTGYGVFADLMVNELK